MARHPADRALAELADFTRVEPPAFLDALVKERMSALLERRRSEIAQERREANDPAAVDSAGRQGRSVDIGRAEAWAFAVGFLAYGAQLADGVARMIWRAMTG